jgi:hypothetical protein
MRVRGGDLSDGEAYGRDTDGNRVRLEIDDSSYEPQSEEMR